MTTMDGAVRLWEYLPQRVMRVYRGHRHESLTLQAVIAAGDADGPLVVAGSEDGSVHTWDLSDPATHAQWEVDGGASAGSGSSGERAAAPAAVVVVDAHPLEAAFVTVSAAATAGRSNLVLWRKRAEDVGAAGSSMAMVDD